MHLVKWIRKNMTRLMAIFVILIMIAFIMPTVLQQLARPRTDRGINSAMWLYGEDGEISYNDIQTASNKLSVLRALYADKLLLSQKDLRLILLGQVLFAESMPSASLCDEVKNMVMQSQLRLSFASIDDFFAQSTGGSELMWILLGQEARGSGCAVSSSMAADLLKRVIPQLTQNTAEASMLVKNISGSFQMTEEQVLQTFAEFLTIVRYSEIISQAEDISEAQLRSIFAQQSETVDLEFVAFEADSFIDEVNEISAGELAKHFDKFKAFEAGQISEDNPFGFGYKIPSRASLEYMLIKLDDVKGLIRDISDEEAEAYYQGNLSRFTEQVKKDPADANSEMITRQKSYAEVAEVIASSLLAEKINSKAGMILNAAITEAESGLEQLDLESATSSDIKAAIGSYASAAEKVGVRNGIKIYAGTTGLLTAERLQTDEVLGALMMPGQSRMPAMLAKLVFSIDELGITKLGPFDPAKPRLYLSIGPLSDRAGEAAAVVRVVDYSVPMPPAGIDYSYELNLPRLDDSDASVADNVFSVKKQVTEDVKRLKAFALAGQRADAFVAGVKSDDWAEEIESLSQAYPFAAERFQIQNWQGRKRISSADLEVSRMRFGGVAGAEMFLNRETAYKSVMDGIFDRFAQVQLEIKEVPMVMEVKPYLSYFAVKSLSRTIPTSVEYEDSRQMLAYREDYTLAQSLAFEHYLPRNITKRMNLRPARKSEAADSNQVGDANDSGDGDGK